MNEADYHPDDWNALMQLVEYANVLVAQETADPADVGFYVKSIDILLASMRMADEEELDYTYEINPIREDDYIAETVVIDAGGGGQHGCPVSGAGQPRRHAAAAQAHTKVSRFYPFAPGEKARFLSRSRALFLRGIYSKATILYY